MIRLAFVGDGPRDERTIPALVSKMLDAPIEPTFTSWREIRLVSVRRKGPRGLAAKLQYVIDRARTHRIPGVVATVDRDQSAPRERLVELRIVADAAPAVPAAVGEAAPHAEAWLLDDEKAVREGLCLETAVTIDAVTKCDPKGELNRLCTLSGRVDGATTYLDLLAAIAVAVEEKRCSHRRATGFEDFTLEVRQKLGQLAGAR